MLIGAHVSPAGGPAKAVERGLERGARAIQIFNQNPRAWKPTIYSDQQVEEFRTAMAESDVDALLIHPVYLLNPGSARAAAVRLRVVRRVAGAPGPLPPGRHGGAAPAQRPRGRGPRPHAGEQQQSD